jgi:hypothetical protein
MVCDAAGSVAVGWPIFSALNAHASGPVRWLAAVLTIAIGLAALDLLIAYAARMSAAHQSRRRFRGSSALRAPPFYCLNGYCAGSLVLGGMTALPSGVM